MKTIKRLLIPHSQWFLILLLLGLALITSGCVTMKDPEASQDYSADVIGVVQPGQVVGQTFVSRRSGLNSIELWLRPEPDSAQEGSLRIELFHSPQDSHPLVSTTVSYHDISTYRPYSVHFSPQLDPPNQTYYLRLETENLSIQVLGRDQDVYPNGTVYINGNVIQADISFQTSYDYSASAMLADLWLLLTHLWLAFPLAVGFWIPGRLLLDLFGLERRFDWGERTAVSVGLSLATIPVLMTWTTFLGLHWNRAAVWLVGGGLSAIYIWRKRNVILNSLRNWRSGFNPRSISLAAFALGIVFLFSLAVRLVMVRDLAAPPWVDSIHHAMITRLIVEQGAFPRSYAPFLDIETANYHAGFHSDVAVFHWLSGLEIVDAMLLFGQVINALTILAVYLFTTTFTKSPAAGVIAGLISGVFTPMPAYLTSWGRYTQLTSLLILPAAFILIKMLLDEKDKDRPHLLVLSAIAAGGLFLTHYRVVAFLACLLIAFMIDRVFRAIWLRSFWRQIPGELGWLGLSAITAIGLTLPWWPETLSTLLIPKLAWGQGSAPAFSDFSWGYLTSAYGRDAMILAGIGLLWALLQRHSFPFILATWVGLMFVLANVDAIGLPGGGFVNNTSVEINLFMPISVLGGYVIGWILQSIHAILPVRWHWASYGSAGLAISVFALIGAKSILPILNPNTMLFRQADRPAMTWINQNIPENATILINPFAWGYGLYAGNDGGYWIVPMAGRISMPPPVLYGLGNNPEQVQHISDVCRQVLDLANKPTELHDYLLTQGIHYIYVGARGGALSPQALQTSPLYKTLYNYEDTWVFQVLHDKTSP